MFLTVKCHSTAMTARTEEHEITFRERYQHVIINLGPNSGG